MTRSKQQARKPKAQTPQPNKGALPTPLRKGPKSAPPAKRKKLKEELDEELSDEDFDLLLGKVKSSEKEKKLKGLITPVKKGGSDESEEEESEDDEDMEDSEDDDDDDDDDGEEEDDDEEEEDDEDDVDDGSEDDDEEDSDDDEEEEEEESSKLAKKSPQAIKKKQADMANNKTASKKAQEAPKKEAAKTAEKKKAAEKTTAKKNDATKKVQPEQTLLVPNLRGTKEELLLFVKNFPPKTTQKDITALCPDVVAIQLNTKKQFAFLKFASEKATNAGHKQLRGKEIRNSDILVDFVGVKSKNKPRPPKRKEPDNKEPCKLYITGFGGNMDMAGLKKLFPAGKSHDLPMKKRNSSRPCGFAFVHFANEKACKKAHDEMQGTSHEGQELTVLYAQKRAPIAAGEKRKNTKTPAKSEAPPAKKAKAAPEKKAKKMPEIVEDDDDEDDDDEEDEDDEDMEGLDMDSDDEDDDDDDDEDDDDDDDEED